MDKEKIKRPEFIVGGILLLLLIAFTALLYISKNSYEEIDVLNLPDNNVVFDLELSSDSENIYVSGWSIIPGESIQTYDVSVVLWDEESEKGFLVPTQMVRRPDVTKVFQDEYNYDNSGFSAIIKKSEMGKIPYGIYLRYRNNNNDIIVKTGRVVEK